MRVLRLGNRIMEHEAKRLRTILVPRGAEVYRNTTQSIPSGAWTLVEFTHARFNEGYWSVALPSRLVVPSGYRGRHFIFGHVAFAGSAAGDIRAVQIYGSGSLGGLAVASTPPCGAGYYTYLSVSTEYPLAGGDFVVLYVYQDSGANLNLVSVAKYSPEFRIVKV